ncbi:MAG TPA: sigma-70 family RNA polymerase sigma factor [Polyangiaceae bacterium]|nr:sigma-70 family RNA polymerase sigma factor [Polyangiaceae bacterium]
MASPLTETGAGAVDGDPGNRLGPLIRAQFGFVWRLSRRIGLSESEAESALREVFAAAAQRIGDIRPDSERAFLFSTTLHVAARARRTRGEHAAVGDAAPALEDLDEPGQAREILGALLEQMPLELRVVFILSEIEQLPSSEISEVIGIPPATVSTRLAEAREDFATHLESESKSSMSLIAAARDERAPPAALTSALRAAGVAITAADRESEASARSAPGALSLRAPRAAGSRSAWMLAASWLALGWLIGLVVVSAVWALSDASSNPKPSSFSR